MVGGVGQGRGISPEGYELAGAQASWHRCPPSPAGPASVPCSTGLQTGTAWGERGKISHYHLLRDRTVKRLTLLYLFIIIINILLKKKTKNKKTAKLPRAGPAKNFCLCMLSFCIKVLHNKSNIVPTFQSQGRSEQSRGSRTWRLDSWSAQWKWWGDPMGEACSLSAFPTEPWKRERKALTYSTC